MPKIAAIIAFFALPWIACGFDLVSKGDHYYSNSNRDLFLLPASAALAGSDVVFSRDATPFANPGSVARLSNSANEASLAYAGFFGNSFSSSLASYTLRLDKAEGIGISFNYLFVPDIPDYSGFDVDDAGIPVYDPARIRTGSASDLFFRFVYGHAFEWQAAGIEAGLGGACNAQRRNLLGWTAYGVGVDGGGYVFFKRSGIGVSLSCENLTTNYLRWSSSYQDAAYPHLRMGLGWQKEITYLYGRIQITAQTLDLLGNEGANAAETGSDLSDSLTQPVWVRASSKPEELLTKGRLGLEYTVYKRVTLRIGTSPQNYFTFGAGMLLFNQACAIDFAYLLHELAGTYQVGVSYRW
jgi:hypothetical protein